MDQKLPFEALANLNAYDMHHDDGHRCASECLVSEQFLLVIRKQLLPKLPPDWALDGLAGPLVRHGNAVLTSNLPSTVGGKSTAEFALRIS